MRWEHRDRQEDQAPLRKRWHVSCYASRLATVSRSSARYALTVAERFLNFRVIFFVVVASVALIALFDRLRPEESAARAAPETAQAPAGSDQAPATIGGDDQERDPSVYTFRFSEGQRVEGPRIISHLIDCAPDQVQIGMPVTVVFEDATLEMSLYKFRPA